MANAGWYQGIEIKGLDEIERRLQALPEKVRRKHVRKVLGDAANLVRDEARLIVRRAPVPTRPKLGPIAEHIETKVWVNYNRANATVGVDWTTHSYGHLLEFGHKLPGGERTREFAFMKPAFENKADEALNQMLTDLRDAVEKEADNGS